MDMEVDDNLHGTYLPDMGIISRYISRNEPNLLPGKTKKVSPELLEQGNKRQYKLRKKTLIKKNKKPQTS